MVFVSVKYKYLYKLPHRNNTSWTTSLSNQLGCLVNIVNPEHKIIKNEEVLFSDALGDRFFKEGEKEQLFEELRPITQKQSCGDLFVYGSSGVGKTRLIKSVLGSIKSHSVIPNNYSPTSLLRFSY